jgi:hypothetical protein
MMSRVSCGPTLLSDAGGCGGPSSDERRAIVHSTRRATGEEDIRKSCRPPFGGCVYVNGPFQTNALDFLFACAVQGAAS